MRRRGTWILVAAAGLASLGASSYLPWEDLTESDWLYAVATRFALVDGNKVHYPTPTAELARLLEGRSETAALRHLAEARLELGDRPGAVAALERWAEAEGAAAWAEAARWGAAHGDYALAFRAAARAVPGLAGDPLRALLDEQVAWAEGHPEAGDALAARATRARLFPDDEEAVEDWIRALEAAGRLAEADAAVEAAAGLGPERRLLLRSDLLADHGEAKLAFDLLDEALQRAPALGPEVREAFAERTAGYSPGAPETWRAALELAFDARALIRLASLFQGQGRGAAAADLLRQVERRHEAGFARAEWLLLSRLHGEIDGVPEAFRALLAAADRATNAEQADDLAGLVRLALRAGGRPLAIGTYNDEPYRWIARLDRTPGFWTGGLSFLLTGQDWKEALARIEAESVPERTFATARALLDELVRRSPGHAEIASLRALVMARHVERGEGREALALLPSLEAAAPAFREEAVRLALLAARQTELPLDEEKRLFKARLAGLAAAGSRPRMSRPAWRPPRPTAPGGGRAWRREVARPETSSYKEALDEAVARLEHRDRSHAASLDLLLGELDRLPDAEELWSDLAARLEGWSLDDGLGPRYERALERFEGAGVWSRAARWYARRARQADLERLAGELTRRFRAAAIFARAEGAASVRLEVPSQPPAGGRVRLVSWADWVRLRALERFPHSPRVFREARSRLVTRGVWSRRGLDRDKGETQQVVVEDALFEERKWALLFADAERREEFFAEAMRAGDLERRLLALASTAQPTPVEDLLLFEGFSRLSRFESAAAPADRLAAAYPGDGATARRVLSLHRSLAALEPGHGPPAAALVARTAPALEDPKALFTELGEMEVEAGHPERARVAWDRILEREPRRADHVLELATLLWDYGRMADALDVVEEGRRRLGRDRLFAFEAGVLREEQRDVQGAIREYLGAALPDDEACFCSFFERDQRALRRLAQLLSREPVFAAVRQKIEALRPGVAADERTFAALVPLARIEPPDPDLDFTADDWIDALDLPADPLGRARRAEARARWRPQAAEAIARVGEALLEKALAMVPKAGDAAFLEAIEPWSEALLDRRWSREREVLFRSALLLRQAELQPQEEERVRREVERARYLFDQGREAEADAAWAALAPRLGALPEGAPRMRAEAERARYLERAKGKDAAAAEWARLVSRYGWSLGMLEDQLAFLERAGRAPEGRGLLEAAAGRAAAGHREALLERLTREALAGGDLAQARRGVTRLLDSGSLGEEQRLGGVRLLARLALREAAGADLMPLARAEAARLPSERHADLYRALAEAAEAEGADEKALTLWIEALNRRLERAWLHAAARGARRSGRGPTLLRFFEEQQARSPRDIRWAVAVREIRLELGDLEGAIAMARTALAVRPDRASLWHEAALLLVRAGRPAEAGDLFEGWQKTRPADEDAARTRSAFYAQAGDAARVMAVEQQALAAYGQLVANEEEAGERVAERRGRAARHLLDLGLPAQAWRLATAGRGAAALEQSGLGDFGSAEVALASSNFLAALRARFDEPSFREAAARVLLERGRFETREEVHAWLLGQVLPAGPPPSRAPKAAALRRVWPFAEAAGMDAALRLSIARRLLSVAPGPWTEPSPTLVEAVADVVVAPDLNGNAEFHAPDLDALHVRDLVRRGSDEALFVFLEPRWRELLARVRSASPVSRDAPVVGWSEWLQDGEALAAFARASGARPERVAELGAVLAERRLWDRLWALAARGWNVGPLVAVLPEAERTAWFRHWQNPSPTDPDAVLRARGEALERVGVALGRLVEGRPGAAADPLLARLRGPRRVGDVLGGDAHWRWPELVTPAPAARGPDAADARVVRRGVDAGRLPGALWGERPGAAWFVLETLVRARERDPLAALVPAELPERGGESERGLLAVRLAAWLGDEAFALEQDAALRGQDDEARFLERLRLLSRAGRTEDARAALEREVRRRQGRLDEGSLRRLDAAARDLGLGDPVAALDPAAPVSPLLLALLYDRRGPAAGSRFHTDGVADFRTALANRWRGRDGRLPADAVRFHLAELWRNDAAPLPAAGLRKLGAPWPAAGPFLARLRVADREEGLAAIGALPDDVRLRALLEREAEPRHDVVRIFRIRVALLRGEDDRADALLDEALAEADAGTALAYAPAVLAPPAPLEDAAASEEGALLEDAPTPVWGGDPTTARMRAYLDPFREAGRPEHALRRVQETLDARRRRASVPAEEWGLALELSQAGPARAALVAELEHAYVRGELAATGLGPVVAALARHAPEEAPRWLGRWPAGTGLADLGPRIRALLALGDKLGVGRLLLEVRRRGNFTAAEEVKAFDLWRRNVPEGAPAAPPAWTAARAFWTRKPAEVGADLAVHLRAHPYDVLAARAALRTISPGDEAGLRRAAAVLRQAPPGVLEDASADQEVLDLRIARGLRAVWPRAAQAAVSSLDPARAAAELGRRRFPAAEVDSALADLARIAGRGAEPALAVLHDRSGDLARAVRAELREATRPPPPPGFVRREMPGPYRPRDLGWPLLAAVLAAEGP